MDVFNIQKREFINSIKYEKDNEKCMLLKIQEELEKIGINKENILYLTKNLTKEQKQRLEDLYKEQIKKYEIRFENYKNKIISIRKKLKNN